MPSATPSPHEPTVTSADGADDPAAERAAADAAATDLVALTALVADWTTVPDIAERMDVPLVRVRQMIADREVISLRTGPRRVVSIPAKFIGAEGPLPELKGTFTVLGDGGMNDLEIVRWLFTPDDSLPVVGAPIDALLAGHKAEIRRRAQALAF